MFTLPFLKDLAERTVATAAGSAIAVLVTAGGLASVDWAQLGSIVGLASLVSILKALVASKIGDPESAALVK